MRFEELKADVRDGGDPATTMQKNFEAERQKEFQQRPLSVWLDNYRSEILGNGGPLIANKRARPEDIITKLRQVEVLMGQGMSRLDAIRQIGVVEQTYYRWRAS